MANPALTLYFDGKCLFCATGMRRLGTWDKGRKLAFVDIALPGFDPAHLNASMEDLNKQIYSQAIGDRQRSVFAWGALIAGLVVWAPQDMLISLQAKVWKHVWLDTFALVCMLPPLIYLCYVERRKVSP